jgi:3-oxoacyl-[acyl-carrier protein] reductase
VKFEGSVAVVTGGGSGVGRAVCAAIASAGAQAIVINYGHAQDAAEETALQVLPHGCRGIPMRADVSDRRQVDAMFTDIIASLGHIHFLVNCAATTRFIDRSDLEALTDDVWGEIMRVNLMGTFYCCRAAAQALRQTRGAVVNIASIAGERASGSSIPYSVSKAAVLQLTRQLAAALAPEVRVNAVTPGLLSTRWYRRAVGEVFAQEQERISAERTPLKGVASAEDVAQAVLGLLACDFVTGQSLIVDGGKSVTY